MKRVLIIRSGALGDLVLTLPVLAALKKRYEGLSIDMMGHPGRLSLLKQCGYVDKVLSIDSRVYTPLFAPGGAPAWAADGPKGAADGSTGAAGAPARMADGHARTAGGSARTADGPAGAEGGSAADPAIRSLRSYDAILSYLPDPDGVFAGNLRRFVSGPEQTGLTVLTGRSRPADGRRIHMTRVLMDAVKPLGADAIADLPAMPSTLRGAADDIRKMNLPSDHNLVAIHPGSGGLEKCWPAERYAALIERLADRGYKPVVTFGPADDKVRRRILPRIPVRDVLVVEDRPLVDVAALYARCRAMIGNDSGMTHLAAATGAPVIGLFGPTDPAVWGPRGKKVRVLWGSEEIGKDVCGLTWKEPFRTRSLSDIDVETPVRVLSELGVTAGTEIPN